METVGSPPQWLSACTAAAASAASSAPLAAAAAAAAVVVVVVTVVVIPCEDEASIARASSNGRPDPEEELGVSPPSPGSPPSAPSSVVCSAVEAAA
jgi:hypothetical protein